MHTINDLVRTGMDYFTGKTVPKASLDSAVAELTSKLDVALARSDALANDLSAANAARKASEDAAAEAANSLEAARAEVATLKARVAELEASQKTVASQAAVIAASAGHPGPLILKPDATSPGANGAPTDIMAARAAITEPAKLAEFDAKHRDRLFAEAQAQLRAARR